MKTFQRRAGALAATYSLRPRNCLIVGSLLALALASWLLGGILAAAEPDGAQQDRLRDPAVIAELVKQLGAASFSQREAAQSELMKAGKEAFPLLRNAAARGDKEKAGRAKLVLDKIELPVMIAAAKHLRSLGGEIGCDDKGVATYAILRFEQPTIGDDDVACVADLQALTLIEITNTRITDTTIERLIGLPMLAVVILRDDCISDKGIARLGNISSLSTLALRGKSLSGSGLEKLAGLSHLNSLAFEESAFSDESIHYLAGLSELRILSLAGNAITNEGLQRMPILNHLERLGLASTRITKAGVRHLAKLPALYCLDIGRTDMDDSGLAALCGLKNLSDLRLSCSKITLPGLYQLKDLPVITAIDADGLGLDRQTALDLMKAVPRLRQIRISEAETVLSPYPRETTQNGK